jgi:hypothetical protein
MTYQKIIHSALACSMVLLAASCKKDVVTHTAAPDHELSVQERLMAHFNLPADAFIRKEGGWLVDGDVFVADATAEQLGMESKQATAANHMVSSSNLDNIQIYVQPDVEPGWHTALTQAIAEWNAIPNCAVHMTESTSGYDMTVSMEAIEEANKVASAGYPSGYGNVGPFIKIDPEFNSYTISQKKRVMAHELGHTLGFMHTDNWGSHPTLAGEGQIIPGTANTDAYSVMNCCQAGYTWTHPNGWFDGFTVWDKYAFINTYPAAAPPAGTQQVYFYYRIGQDHFYTKSWSELGPRQNTSDWNYAHITCRTLTSQQSGSVALRRYRYNNGSQHYYTTSTSNLPSGAVYEGNVGYVYTTQQPGTIPLYRFGSDVPGAWQWYISCYPPGPAMQWQAQHTIGYVYPPPVPPIWPY